MLEYVLGSKAYPYVVPGGTLKRHAEIPASLFFYSLTHINASACKNNDNMIGRLQAGGKGDSNTTSALKPCPKSLELKSMICEALPE